MAKKKIASIPVSTAYSKKTTLGDNWRSTPTFERGWCQKEIDYHLANVPETNQRTVYSDKKVDTPVKPKAEK
jgi:hypothetical protein